MDPSMCASRAFLAELKRFWRTDRGRVVRIVAAGAHRAHVIKSLRLQEHAPENRWPLFLYEAPFVDACSYFRGLEKLIQRDYEHIREGAANEGIALAAFGIARAPSIEMLGSVERAALQTEHAADLLGEKLEGLFVALIPVRISAATQWSESVAALARIPFHRRVRLAVLDPVDGSAARIAGMGDARFMLYDRQLGAWLKQLGPRVCAGPARGMRATTIAPTPAAARKVRTVLIDAALAAAGGQAERALKLLGDPIMTSAEGRVMVDSAIPDNIRFICRATAPSPDDEHFHGRVRRGSQLDQRLPASSTMP